MELLAFVPIAVAVVAGVAQIAKSLGLEAKWAPLLEVGLGIVLVVGGEITGSITIGEPDLGSTHVFWATLYGVIVGLTSAGLWQYGEQVTVARNGKTHDA